MTTRQRLVLSILAVSMLASAAFADGGERPARYDRHDKKPFKISEFFCAVAGGTAAGVIVKNAGASDPITFLGVLVGGLIGADFCRWVSDDKNLGAQAAAFEASLDGKMCSEKSWSSSHYRGQLKVLAESWQTSGHNAEASSENICKYFETTIHEHSGKFVGRTKAWACKSPQNSWIVTRENSISKKGVKYCNNPDYDYGDGSVSVRHRRIVEPTEINIGRIRGHWGLEHLRRHVNDYGVERTLKLARRTKFRDEVEVGVLKALSDDGRGVIIYFSPRRQVVAPISDVGIECRATQLCYDSEVSTRDGLHGTFQYIFQNGDVVINDVNNGIKLRPGHYLE